VSVPQGKHRVEFKDEPLSFKIGLIISLLTLFSIAVVSLILFFRKENLFLPQFLRPITWIPVNKN
jgi:uncharacterized membrane protein YfhO